MPFIPVPNGAKVALNYTFNGQPVVNTLWFQYTGGVIDAQSISDLASGVNDWWVTRMKPALSSEITLETVDVVAKDVAQGFIGGVAVGLTGDLIGSTLPANVAYCLKFTTGLAGRSARGRNYIAAIRESDVDGNTIDAACSTALLVAYRTLLQGGLEEIPNWVWSVVSFQSNNAPRAVAQVLPITWATTTGLRVDTQRRRLGKE